MKLTFSDKNHSYYLDGKRCKSVTGIAKIPDDTFALDEWRKRMVAIGMATEPSLTERVAAHFDDRAKMTELCEEAMNVAKSHVAAGLGTAAHRIAERIDLGEDIIDTPLSLAFRAAWTLALDKAGLDVIPEFVERIVVHPDWRVCGALDRIMRRRSDGALVVVDLKTGEGAVKYPHSIACQIALYANAPLMAGPMGNPSDKGNVYTETFEAMPEGIDLSVGYIVHAAGVVDGVAAEVLPVNIAAGWEVVRSIIIPTLAWRKRDDVIGAAVAIAPIAAPEPATDDDFDRANGDPCSSTPTSSASESMASEPTNSTSTPQGTDSSASSTCTPATRRHQILARLTALPDAQKVRIKAHWPNGMPSLKSSHEHTDAELDAIEAVMAEHTKTVMEVATLARRKEEPCPTTTTSASTSTPSEPPSTSGEPGTSKPGGPSTSSEPTSAISTSDEPPKSSPTSTRLSTTDEGPPVDDADVVALRKAFSELDTAEQLWLSVMVEQCKRAGYPLSMELNPATKRRWAIGTALVHLARLGVGTDDTHEATVRALLGVVLGEEVQPIIVTGTAIAALTIDEAGRLAVLAQAVGGPDLTIDVPFDMSCAGVDVYGPAVEAARRVA